jgi:integrase/recombinase XerD
MAGKQAKTLAADDLTMAAKATAARHRRYKARDRVILLLSAKAGLRACEIAGLTWAMVLDAQGRVADRIEVHDGIAKKGSGRTIPMNPELGQALRQLRKQVKEPDGPVIRSERGGHLRASSIVNWFQVFYCELGLEGCSSHSGRRTFITNGAKLIFRAGGSLRDIQQLAGHRSIEQTQTYIDGDALAKRRLVTLI